MRNCLWQCKETETDQIPTPQRITVIDTDRSCLLVGEANRDVLGQRTIQSLGTYLLEVIYKATTLSKLRAATDVHRGVQAVEFALEKAVQSGKVFTCMRDRQYNAVIVPNIPNTVKPWICGEKNTRAAWEILLTTHRRDKSKFLKFYRDKGGDNFRVAMNAITKERAYTRSKQLIFDLMNIAAGRA